MRGMLVAGLCALFLVSGPVAGLAHVHGGAWHHEASPGLHLDHAHIEHHGGQPDPGVSAEGCRLDHPSDDAVYLSQSAVRALPTLRVVPAIVSVALAIESPVLVSDTPGLRPGRPRDPPGVAPARMRAPPA